MVGWRLCSSCSAVAQRLQVPRDDRMAVRVELRRSQRRREAAEELVGELETRRGHARHLAVPLRRGACANDARARRRADAARALGDRSLEHGDAPPASRCAPARPRPRVATPPSAAAPTIHPF